MPFFDYVNVENPEDIWEDAFHGKYDDRPETLEKEGKVYKFKQTYTKADTIFRNNGIGGWTNNSRVVNLPPERIAYHKKVSEEKKYFKECQEEGKIYVRPEKRKK